jgi:hypothetical protein
MEFPVNHPHALYVMYNRKMEPIYVGFSRNLFLRLQYHGYRSPWIEEIAAIKVLWYPDRLQARKAEAELILKLAPKYNQHHNHSHLQVAAPPEKKRSRGDGIHCPKCGNPKESRTKAYCRLCMRLYEYEQRLKSAARGTPAKSKQRGRPKNKNQNL